MNGTLAAIGRATHIGLFQPRTGRHSGRHTRAVTAGAGRRRVLAVALATVVMTTSYMWSASRSEASTVQAAAAASSQGAASKKAKALAWAKTENHEPYCWGGEGYNCYDCSGLTWRAYKRQGITLPRTSGAQRSSSMTYHVSRYKARPGDLVFNGSGHVEFFVKLRKNSKGAVIGIQSYGAGSSATDIRYRNWNYVPHIEAVKGAG